MKEKKKLLQKHELCTKGKVHIMNFLDEENVDIMDFWIKRRDLFKHWKLVERFFLSIYETCMIF